MKSAQVVAVGGLLRGIFLYSKTEHINDMGLRTIELFAGAGGGVLGSILLGHLPVCYVEIEPYCQRILQQRIKDGIIPDAPIWGDVRTFDGKPWRGHVDIITGGFPCQDISVAGQGAGIDGEKSGMWYEMARIIREVRPRFVFVENSPALTFRGLGQVLGDLASMGYDAEWCVLGADSVGAPHQRDRIWILANADIERREKLYIPAKHDQMGQLGRRADAPSWWGIDPAEGPIEPPVGRVAYGVAHRVDRLKAIGNGQVPAVVVKAWNELMGRITINTIYT